LAFHHDPDHRLGTRGTQQYPPLAAERSFRRHNGCAHGTITHDVALVGQTHIDHGLRELAHLAAELMQARFGADHRIHRLQSRHQAIAGAGDIETDHVARRFSSELPLPLLELGHDVAIADRGPREGDIQRLQPQLQTQIAHHGADNAPELHLASTPVAGDHIENFVPVDNVALVIDQNHTVAVAIECDAQISLFRQHLPGQLRGRSGTALVIDVESVRRSTNGFDGSTELPEDVAGNVIGGTVGTIHYDLQSAKLDVGGNGTLAVFDVAATGIGNARGLADELGIHGGDGLLQIRFNFEFNFIRQLGALTREELDAVVVIGIV